MPTPPRLRQPSKRDLRHSIRTDHKKGSRLSYDSAIIEDEDNRTIKKAKTMTEPIRDNPDELDRHNRLVDKANALVQNEIFIQDRMPGKLGFLGRMKINQAIKLYDEALEIHPENWSVMWFLGKIYQRLGQPADALEWLAKAHALNPDQPDVAREASLSALDAGDYARAVEFGESALKAPPDDAALASNLALAYLLVRRLPDARRTVDAALAQDSGDTVTQTVQRIIDEVESGKRPQPTSMRDIEGG
jgi:tetratricopeptide (TPR) repeat protein